MNKTNDNLLPCPFCGAEAELKASHGGILIEKDEHKKYPRTYWVQCIKDCQISSHFPEDVIHNWNNRNGV